MNLLLDTHVWLWGLLEPERLGRAARDALEDSAAVVHLSPISVWEALVLVRRGRLTPGIDAGEWIRDALEASRTTMLPLTHPIAIRSEAIPGLTSADPADRFLAATALEHGMPLMTADAALLALETLPTIPAR